MRVRSALLISGLAAAALLPGTWANAAPLDKGHFDDVFTSDDYDCDGTPARDAGDLHINFLFNQRGSSAFPYYRESFRGSFVTTNLNTGGTITVYATGGSRWYDQHGRLVLKDPGNIRFAFDIDYNGTPGNPEDDMDVSNSFRIVRESTGRNDTEGRDFCADLVQFTGAPG